MIELSEVKCHLVVDHDLDDGLITEYINSAVAYVEDCIHRKLYESEVPDTESNGIVVNPLLKQSILMVIGYFYENRGCIAGEMPNINDLIGNYVRYEF